MFVINLYARNLELLGYQVPTVFLLSVVAPLVGLGVFFFETRRLRLSYSVTFIMVLLTSIVGGGISRFFFYLSRLFLHHDLDSQQLLLGFYPEKKVYFGYLLTVFIVVLLGAYLSNSRKHFYKYLDIFMLGHVAIMIFYRIGNMVSYFHPGKITDVPWGVYNLGHIRHEPSLYEAISLAVLFLVAILIRKNIRIAGSLSIFILAWVSLSRVITDFFRSDDLPESNFHFSNGITMNQVAFFGLFLISLFLMFRLQRRSKSREQTKLNKSIDFMQPGKIFQKDR
jgi:prolipoprotein diacylglyceryltransferase